MAAISRVALSLLYSPLLPPFPAPQGGMLTAPSFTPISLFFVLILVYLFSLVDTFLTE
jgi:hypothetical protein